MLRKKKSQASLDKSWRQFFLLTLTHRGQGIEACEVWVPRDGLGDAGGVFIFWCVYFLMEKIRMRHFCIFIIAWIQGCAVEWRGGSRHTNGFFWAQLVYLRCSQIFTHLSWCILFCFTLSWYKFDVGVSHGCPYYNNFFFGQLVFSGKFIGLQYLVYLDGPLPPPSQRKNKFYKICIRNLGMKILFE